MLIQSLKETYYKNDDFHFEIEKCGKELFIHCTVTNWKLSALKIGYEIFSKLLLYAEETGFNRIVTLSPNPKFAKLFGGNTMHSFIQNNIEYEVIVWDLK